LNLLFGNKFQTLEASRDGRAQTTKGIWMGVSKPPKDGKTIFIFDVEGVDGRERGEKEQGFEKKTSLFSLALSEVLMVNMWHNDVGRYNAGNISLLKIVFEEHLKLFGKQYNSRSRKTLLLFVIRDYLSTETPLEKLREIILDDMQKNLGISYKA